MWRPWCQTSSDTEENIQVIPETDIENHVEESINLDKSANPEQPSIVVPETQEGPSTSTSTQQNILASPKYMQYLYLQSQHNEQAGKILKNILFQGYKIVNNYLHITCKKLQKCSKYLQSTKY